MTYRSIENQERTGKRHRNGSFSPCFSMPIRGMPRLLYPVRGKPWDRQPNSGKLRRKLVSVPGLRRISGQLSPKRLSTRGDRGWVWGLMERSQFGVKWFVVRGVKRGDPALAGRGMGRLRVVGGCGGRGRGRGGWNRCATGVGRRPCDCPYRTGRGENRLPRCRPPGGHIQRAGFRRRRGGGGSTRSG